jgi:hypothetical protein
MSFADPTVVTINAIGKSLVRINADNYSSEYKLREVLGEYTLNVRNSDRTDPKTGVKTFRHNIELIHIVYPVAPSTTQFTRKVYLVIENQAGDTLVDPVNEALGLMNLMTASSGANISKMLNSES